MSIEIKEMSVEDFCKEIQADIDRMMEQETPEAAAVVLSEIEYKMKALETLIFSKTDATKLSEVKAKYLLVQPNEQ